MNSKKLLPSDFVRHLEKSKPYIVPMGGCGEFGMNLTCYIFQKKIIIVDAGSLFPDQRKLGVSSIIPSLHHSIFESMPILAYMITHGHEDHIGAVPYLFRDFPAPIYAPTWAIELLKNRFKEQGLDMSALHPIKGPTTVQIAPFSVEYIHVNHSIPHSYSFLIKCGNYSFFHSGDFKIDRTGFDEKPVNLSYLKKIGDEGVDLFLCDSTNAHRPGPTPSEQEVVEPMRQILASTTGRVFVATFSSNLTRLKTICELCRELKKKLIVCGKSLKRALEVGMKLNMLDDMPFMYFEEESAKVRLDPSCVILTTGCQGEFRSALYRIAMGEHRGIKIKENDLVVFSSSVIPGNEKNIIAITDHLKKQGARVIGSKENPKIHVSGHAYQDDISTFYELLKPRVFIPVHGDFAQQQANQSKQTPNAQKQKSLMMENGDLVAVTKEQVSILGRLDFDRLYVDDGSYLPMGKKLLDERLKIGELGLLSLDGVVHKTSRRWARGPFITSFGVAVPKKFSPDQWKKHLEKKVLELFDISSRETMPSQEELNEFLRQDMRKYLEKLTRKKPVLISKIWLI
ncbi:MAG: ribonuclease J [Oligoflexales bacterium]|nr:ribonuclease J [Oligoflexales bacterium]